MVQSVSQSRRDVIAQTQVLTCDKMCGRMVHYLTFCLHHTKNPLGHIFRMVNQQLSVIHSREDLDVCIWVDFA